MPQLTKITFQRAEPRYFKWPYHANVMKIFEIVSRTIVFMFSFSLCARVAFDETQKCELAIQTGPALL